MKITLDKEIMAKARQYHQARVKVSKIRKLLDHPVANHFFNLCFAIVFVWGLVDAINLTVDKDSDAGQVIDAWAWVAFVVVLVLTYVLLRFSFWRMVPVELDIKHSSEGIEIDRSNLIPILIRPLSRFRVSTTKRNWRDYTQWFEKEGLLLLYPHKDLLSNFETIFDLIDSNQLSEEEKSTLMELLEKNVRKVT